ncbi:hypothetical protein FRC02_011013 [Tulasnella sp. 418]|nr:hypothetical protein FRC02_011013 [Tulasnella sp. 418]
MDTLKENVEQNRHLVADGVVVKFKGYEWGTDVGDLIELLQSTCTSLGVTVPTGYDIIFLSDLLHYHGSHFDLLRSCAKLVSRDERSRIYVAAGKYTSDEICNHFFEAAPSYGFVFSEAQPNDGLWHGEDRIGGWSHEDLCLRKSNVRWWIGRRNTDSLERIGIQSSCDAIQHDPNCKHLDL